MGGRGRGQAPRLKAEQFGLSKDDMINSKAPPEEFPPRQPTIPPAAITEAIRNTLDVGLSMKEEIRCRMDAGKFTPCLAYPSELDGKCKKKKKRSRKAVDVTQRLDELAKHEDKAAEDSDADPEGGSNASSSDEEEARDSDDSKGSESNDDEMDVGNDYYQVPDNDDDEDMGPPSEDEEREAMA